MFPTWDARRNLEERWHSGSSGRGARHPLDRFRLSIDVLLYSAAFGFIGCVVYLLMS
jgi:hypothetical protein